MQRTTIVASAELLERLRRIAAERGISRAVLVREALEEKVRAFRPRPRSLGIGDSGESAPLGPVPGELPFPRAFR